MSFLFARGGKQKPAYTGLQLQTSSSAIPVTLMWGANRFSPNIIWYDGFKANKQKKKAGKGAPKQTTYTYSTDLILALGEGQMSGVGKVWKDKDQKASISDVGLSFFNGSDSQTPWGYLTTKYPDAALAYRQTAYLAGAGYDLGDQASLPNHTFEVFGRAYNTASWAYGAADCAVIIDEFLTSPQFGVGFDDSRVDQNSLLSGPNATTTGDSAYQTYCRAMGFGLSPILSDQEPARDTLARWLMLTNSEMVWTGYSVKFMPYAYANVVGNGVTFLGNATPIYTLTDDNYVGDKEDPVKVDRVGPEDAYNFVKVVIHDRENSYNELPIEWKDQSLIEQYGERAPGSLKAIEITDRVIASKMVELYSARKAYIRNTYHFTLGPEYVLLEPMDLLTAEDPEIGPVLVQISRMEEDEDGNFKIEAKQVLGQTSTTNGFVVQPPEGNNQNTGVIASPVNPPILFEPPANLSGGVAQVWAAVSGGDGTDFDPFWGGCEVFVSTDGVEFQNVGEIDSPARMGILSANLSAYGGANPDAVNTLAVDLSMSGAELLSVTADDAEDQVTLCYVDGEFLSYQNATLTALYEYDLDDLWRGLNGSTPGAHLAGSEFARLDENIFKFDLPAEYIGKPLEFKFQSYNIWGQGFQDLSDCVAYPYTPDGTGFEIAPPASTTLSFANVLQADGTNIIVGTVVVGASTGPYLDHYDVEITNNGGATWVAVPSISATGDRTTFQPALASTNYQARARAVSSAVDGIPSSWVNSAVVNTGALGGTAPNPPTTLVATGGNYSNRLTWVAPVSGAAVAKYNLYAINAATGSFGSAVLVGSVEAATTFFVHNGLGANDTWRYWVKAANAAGESTELGPQNATTNAAAAGGVDVEDDGTPIVTGATVLNFTGAGVTVTSPGAGLADIDISGGGGGGGGGDAYVPLTITNPGAETGSTSGWTVPTGSFTAANTSAGGRSPYQGSWLWRVGANALNEMYQDINVSAYAAQIDTGKVVLLAGCALIQDFTIPELGGVAVEFYNGSSTLLQTRIYSVLSDDTNGDYWQVAEIMRVIPTGTRTIRLFLIADRNDGTNNDLAFDEVFAGLFAKAAGSPNWDFSPPLASLFPTLAGTVTPTLTDDPDVGLIVSSPAGSGLIVRGALRSIPSPTGDWSVTAKIITSGPGGTQTGFGLCLWHTTDNLKWIQFSMEGRNDIRAHRFAYPAGFNADIVIYPPLHYMMRWQRIRKVGTTIFYDVSSDGKLFINIGSQSATAYFTTPPNLVGVGMYLNNNTYPYHFTVPYWASTGL